MFNLDRMRRITPSMRNLEHTTPGELIKGSPILPKRILSTRGIIEGSQIHREQLRRNRIYGGEE